MKVFVDFVSLSSSKRDEDLNSEFDRFESFLVKRNEALYIQNKVNSQETMKTIEKLYGPFDQEEIEFYMKSLYSPITDSIINSFQKSLVFNLFYKYFGNPESINSINKEDYVKLLISAKRILQANNMVILPYIISSKVERLVTRNNVNKKEFVKLEMSPYYALMMEKYKNDKIIKYVLYLIATILCSEFRIIELHERHRLIENML